MEIELEFSPYASYQRKIIDSPCRYTITEASTKVGKTYSHIVWLLTRAVEEGELGRNYWWVAPVSSQAEIAFDRMERYLGVLINRRLVKTNKSKLYIQLWHGARIWFKSADKPDSLYGEDVYAAVFDEFTRAKATAWYALRSTITKTEAPVKFIGNKTHPKHWGSKLVGDVEKGNMGADWEYHCITAWDAVDEGILSREEILAAQRELPDDIFASLYEVKWIEVNGNPFWRHIDLGKVVRPVAYDPRLAVYLSFDYNKRNSCLVAQRTGRERRYIEEYYMLGGDGEDLEALVQEICFKYRHNIIHVTGDASGRAGSAFTSGNASGRMLLEMYFERHKAEWVYFDQYPTSNPEHVNSRLICNALTKNLDVVIDPGCVTLISDIRRVKTTVEGGMDKADMNKEDYGHMNDTLRYDLMNFDFETFTQLGYAA